VRERKQVEGMKEEKREKRRRGEYIEIFENRTFSKFELLFKECYRKMNDESQALFFRRSLSG
jgi:hypothetical protein